MDREGKVKGAMLEAAAIVDDICSQCIGGFMVAIDLLELAILPTLINNAGTWTEMDKQTEERLEELQLFFVRLILRVPVSTPKAALRSETGLLSMKDRVDKEKVMLIHHLKSHDESCVARQVYDQQLQNNWPGLGSEARDICMRIKVENVNITLCSKNEFKDLVNKAFKRENKISLRSAMEGKVKLQNLVTESCNMKEYFRENSMTRMREMFRIKTNMNEIKGNFKHDVKNKVEGIACVACWSEDEVNSHVMTCDKYQDLRVGRDLDKDSDLVNFFRDVMARRDEIQKGK